MAKRGPKPKPPEEASPEMMVLSIKMTPAFHAWLAEYAESQRDTMIKLMERAVVDHARRAKFPRQAPKRTIR